MYLTAAEIEQFGAWLAESSSNPAVELLASLQILEINTLEDVDSILEKIRNFYQAVNNIIAANSYSEFELGDQSDVRLKFLSADDTLGFSSFCLEKAGASQFDYEKIEKLSCMYDFFDTYNSLLTLKETLFFLHQYGCLKAITGEEKIALDSFVIVPEVIFFKKFLSPLESLLENKSVKIPESLCQQLNNLLEVLKNEGNKRLKTEQALKEMIDEANDLLAKIIGLVFDLGNDNFAELEKLKNVETFSANLPSISSVFGEIIIAVVNSIEHSIDRNFANSFSEYLAALVNISAAFAHRPDLKSALEEVISIFEQEFRRFFVLGKSKVKIENAIGLAVSQVTSSAEMLAQTPDDDNKKHALLDIIATARGVYRARAFLHPLIELIDDQQLMSIVYLKRELSELVNVFEQELALRLKHESQITINNQFGQLIQEITAFVRIMGQNLSGQEKLQLIDKMKTSVNRHYSILPESVIGALEKLISAAFANAIVNNIDRFITFFNPNPAQQTIKHLVEHAQETVVVSNIPAPTL